MHRGDAVLCVAGAADECARAEIVEVVCSIRLLLDGDAGESCPVEGRPHVAAEIIVAIELEIETAVRLTRSEEVFVVGALAGFRPRRKHFYRRTPTVAPMNGVVRCVVMLMSRRPGACRAVVSERGQFRRKHPGPALEHLRRRGANLSLSWPCDHR